MLSDAIAKRAIPSRADLESLTRRSNVAGTVRVATHFGAICLSGALLMASAGAVWVAPLLVVQAWLVAFLFMPLHETAHKTAFANPRANVVIGHICAAAAILPYEYYTLFHWAHHRHTQDPERDPELVVGTRPPASIGALGFWFLGLRQLFGRVRLLLRHAVTGHVTAPWVPAGRRGLVVREARFLVVLYACLAIGSVAAGSTLLLWTWLVPLILGQAFLRPYLLAEHSGCGTSRDAFENTRTTFTSGIVRWFTWNMPFHTEHHAYPNIPFHALPRLHALVHGRLIHTGAGYRAVTRQVWRWFRQRAA